MLLVLLLVFTTLAFYSFAFLRRKRASYFGNIKTLERVQGFRRFHISPGILVVKLIVVSLLFLVATNTLQIARFQPISDTDYVLLLDASSSMAQSDYNPSRLTAAKNIATDWVNVLPNGTKVGLVAFSEELIKTSPLTLDKTKIKNDIKSVDIHYNQSGTALDFALSYGINLFNASTAKRAILLFTDGTNNVSPSTVSLAKSMHVSIYAFGIGSNKTQTYNLTGIPADLKGTYNPLTFNFTRLEKLSNQTNGTAYKVSNQKQLQQAFRDATYQQSMVQLNSSFYVLILIALISIIELFVYAHLGGI